MDLSWPLVVAGAFVGFAVGLTGMGGGALMTPIMMLIFGINPTAAVGSDLAASVAMKPVGAYVHHRAGTVRWDIVRWLMPTAVPAGFAGAFLLSLFGDGPRLQDALKLAVGASLLLAVLGVLARMALSWRRQDTDSHDDEPVPVRRTATLVIGLVGGLIVGVTSVGSGSLIIVMLMLTHPRLRANALVGTDLVQALPLVTAAALGHLIAGNTELALAGTLLLGAIPAIYLGAKLSTRAPSGALRWALLILLLASGLKLWHVPNSVTLAVCGVAAAACVTAGLVSYRRQPATPSPTLQGRREPAVDEVH